MKRSVDDSLLKIERIPDIVGIDEAHCTSEQDPEGWHVQVCLFLRIFLTYSHRFFLFSFLFQ